MSVNISALGVIDAVAAQQAAAKAAWDAAAAQQSRIIPVNPAAPTGPLPPPRHFDPKTEIDTFFSTPSVVAPEGQADPPLVRAAREKAKRGIPWKTVGIVAGVVAVGGLVTWMMVKTSRGFRRPAMAGLAGHRRRRRHRR